MYVLCLSASGDRGRDSSAREFVSSIFHAANKRIRRSRDKSGGRIHGERDGTISEPNSYSERNIDHEIELRQLQELLRTGRTAEQLDEANLSTLPVASSHNSSIISSTSSAASSEHKDVVSASGSVKTADSPTRRECRASASLKERRTYFMQNGCNQPAAEQKRNLADTSRSSDGAMSQGSVDNTAVTSNTSDPFTTLVSPSKSRSGNTMTPVPSSRAAIMQQAIEQEMQHVADDLQRTFSMTTGLSLRDVSPVLPRLSPCQQHEAAADTSAVQRAADSQSVTSDYSTMSSVYGGHDSDCLRNRLGSADQEFPGLLAFETQKVTDRSAVGSRQKQNELSLSAVRSQSSGNFSLSNSCAVDTSLGATASTTELSQESVDSAVDRLDQLSLSLGSQMSDSQISETDNLLQTVAVADKSSVLAERLSTGDQKSGKVDSSCVQPPAVGEFEELQQLHVSDLMPQSDGADDSWAAPMALHDFSATKTDCKTGVMLDDPSCSLSKEPDVCGVPVDKSSAEVPDMETSPARPDQVPLFHQNTACGGNSKVVPSACDNCRQVSQHSSEEQVVQSSRPVHRLVRRHTFGGTGDLVMRLADPKSESPFLVQLAPLQAEERLSAWQRLKPAVKVEPPNFGMWLATQRRLHHARSSPALFTGVALTSCQHGSLLNCQSLVV